MTDSGVTAHFPHETDMQSIFSDVFAKEFAQIESRFNPNHSKTGIHDHSARITAISTVDKGIHAARQFLRSQLTRRNALMPISRLPPEILARVFHLLVLEEPPFFERRKLGWIKVTHICQHWRQIALNNSSLWTRIPDISKNTKWISEMLARAKNALLDIEYDGARSSPESLLKIPPHLPHTRQLRFHYQSTLHFDSIREIFSWEAPALERFELTVSPYSPMTFPDLGENMLFKGHAPRLRAFSLSGVVIPWSLVPRGRLTRLKIACPEEDAHSPGDFNEFIDLLVNCPGLEILALESSLPSRLTEFPHDQTIHLPNLSHLRLSGSTSRIVNMLKTLKLPSSVTLHLDCISKTTHNDSEVLLLRVISAHFQSPAPVEFKRLTVTTQSERHMTRSLNVTASTFPSTLPFHQTQNVEGDVVGNPELVLSFSGLSEPGRSTDLLKQVCEMLPISNLEFISISADNRISININWVELFGCCTNVTTMQAIGLGTSNFVRALTVPMVTNAGSGEEGRKLKHDSRESTPVQLASTAHAHAAIFPKLKYLELAKLNFSDSELTSDMLFDDFERGLQQRMAASGASLISLRISDCDIGTENVDDLKELIEDFHWDGSEGLIDGFESVEAYERHLDGEDTFGVAFRGRVYTHTAERGWFSEYYDYPDDSDDHDEW